MYYAISHPIKTIVDTWLECKALVTGVKGACFKSFSTRKEAETFLEDKPRTEPVIPDYYVYTDGSCIGNGTVEAKAGIGIYFGPSDPRNVSRRVEGRQTNNTGELCAILETFPLIEADIEKGRYVVIVSDSDYAIRCITEYGPKHASTGWKKDFPNKDLIRRVYDRYHSQPLVSFLHVRSHTGHTDIHSMGNAEADRLANEAVR